MKVKNLVKFDRVSLSLVIYGSSSFIAFGNQICIFLTVVRTLSEGGYFCIFGLFGLKQFVSGCIPFLSFV